MQEHEIDTILTQIKDSELPPCPSSLEARILRRVHQDQVIETSNWLSWLGAFAPSTTAIVASVALLALGSAFFTALSASAYASQNGRQAAASQALDFDFVRQTELVKFEK
ncbi:hypothetical protein H5P28_19510 [Ruficoccus amylovorans]|uniref:Uncharacterized protein n=1 Tax=Ruficoccus amylovorans TaxID=1804625 RepID=A0A842HIX5_9BACT|nr:hypothetical protein [Ruficoccus amylovorans]MBC2596463.1 hypothetical protein [Ruficoccus amylovorans]